MGAALYRLVGLATCFGGRGGCMDCIRPWVSSGDVIMQSVNQVEARRRAKDGTEVQAIVKSRADEIFRDAATPVSGDPNGDVTLVEFFDYNCPYCRQMAPVMTKAEEADPQLRIAYKE